MTHFAKLKEQFAVNWTTILAGWKGLGVFSPWPERSAEYPPLLSVDELADYANERLASSSDATEEDMVVKLLSLNLYTESREVITEHLTRLSDLCGYDSSHELRKWRVVLLEDLLDHLPSDPLYGLIALTEFWQSFGFPPDSPHEVQGKENTLTPDDYYQEDNYQRSISRHKAWIEQEKAGLLVP
jgi:hypothetical protein